MILERIDKRKNIKQKTKLSDKLMNISISINKMLIKIAYKLLEN